TVVGGLLSDLLGGSRGGDGGGCLGGALGFVEGGFERDGDEVGAAGDDAAVLGAVHAAVDAAERADERFGRYAPLQGDADDAPEGFAVGVGFVAGLAAVDEHFAGVVVAVAVDGDEEALLAAGVPHELHLVGEAAHALGTLVRGPGDRGRLLGHGGGSHRSFGLGGRLVLLLFGLAGGEHLEVTRAVTVDRDALAAFLPRELVGGVNVFDPGLVGEVDGLGQGVAGEGHAVLVAFAPGVVAQPVVGALDGGLHEHVVFGGDVVRGDERLEARVTGQVSEERQEAAVVLVEGGAERLAVPLAAVRGDEAGAAAGGDERFGIERVEDLVEERLHDRDVVGADLADEGGG